MILEGLKSSYAFTRNPLWLASDRLDPELASDERGRLVVTRQGATIFEGVFNTPLRMDVADILEASADEFKEPAPDGSILYLVEDAHTLQDRKCDFTMFNLQGDEADHVACIPIVGGCSRQEFLSYQNIQSDIFQNRFLADDCNFFLLPEDASWLIRIKEREAGMLYFLQDGDGVIDFVNLATGKTQSLDIEEGGLYAIDVNELRREFALGYGGIASVMDVKRNGKFACRIVIEYQQGDKEGYVVKYRNSFGFFELLYFDMQLTRKVVRPEDQEGNMRADVDYSGFYNVKERGSMEVSYTGTANNISAPLRIVDMLQSSEVYLLGVADFPIRVIPSVESLELLIRPVAPQSIDLEFKACSDWDNISGNAPHSIRKPRVFTTEFNNRFN